MTAATQDLFGNNAPSSVAATEFHYPVAAATTIYQGTMVGVDGSGNAQPLSDTSGLKFVGIASDKADNSGGSAGDVEVEVQDPAHHGLYLETNATSPTKAWVGLKAYAADDNTVALTGSVSNSAEVGEIKQVNQTGTNGRVVVDTSMRSVPDS